MNGWIGVDLDGTLAEYHSGNGIDSIGVPIMPMVKRVKDWLRNGHPDNGLKDVRIFTARVSPDGHDHIQVWKQNDLIGSWCERHIGQRLPITYFKDYGMVILYDDRAVQVEHNTGRLIEDTLV